MKSKELKVADAYVYTVDRYEDQRGYFQEVFSERKKDNYPFRVLQTNVSYSNRGVVRGLHIAPFSKLCTCVRGCLFDVVVDMREHSKTYLQWDGVWLDEHNKKQLYVPPNCAHGFFCG